MRNVTIVVLCLCLVGCSGTMRGMVRGGGEQVSIAYNQGIAHDDLTVTLPDGESFSGKAVMVGKSTSIVQGFGTANAWGTGGKASAYGSSFGVASTYTGNVQAVLFGNRGRTMQCQLQYADTGGLTNAGGVGVCETSDGKILDIQW